jgi:hypothetical protein
MINGFTIMSLVSTIYWLWPSWKDNIRNYQIEEELFLKDQRLDRNNSLEIWSLWILTFQEGHNGIIILH